MKKAIEYIKKIEANMSGNEELTPLKMSIDILKQDTSGCSRNIFLLTDGGVGCGGNCTIPQLIAFGEEHKEFAAVHTIGIGNGVEKNFCYDMAAKSGGHCTIVTEAEMQNDEMSGLIINSLEMAAKVGIQAAQVDFKGASLEVENLKTPQFLREGDVYRKLAVFNSTDLSQLNFEFKFKNPRNNYQEESYEFNGADATVV